MDDLLHAINTLRNVPRAPWREQVQRVAVILTSSRSGSTLFKAALAQHPDIAALDGEAEPYLALTGNGFASNSACRSDAFIHPENADALADNIFDDLTIATQHLPPLPELKKRWHQRLLLQFPALFTQPHQHTRLVHALDESFAQPAGADGKALEQAVLGTVFRNERWRIGYYDGKDGAAEGIPFGTEAKLEEPPFVLPKLQRRSFTADDLRSKVLLFKTPSDAYRIGLYERLFPQAEIRYLHLVRGFAQCVNGLMDGWLSPTGFFAHDMERAGVPLAIRGYSDQRPFGQRWWKFDLPPNWRDFTASSLEEVCLNQWLSCHRSILDSGVTAHRLAFEDFLDAPATVLARACAWLGLPPMPHAPELPVTMATEAPGRGRWRKRNETLLAMAQRPPVASMMQALGYTMEPATWQ
ncbi:hypothetical protein [Chitinimonas sp.]|uniref:hypothetical protein n=1 Tax=Chitinimonas sp. TaxID=1934313 RepID=UPI002F94EC03